MGSNFRSGEPCRRDPNDFEWFTLHRQARAHYGRVSAEFSLPERVTQHDWGGRTAAHIILGVQQASDGRCDAERGKKFAGNSEDVRAVRPLALADTQPCVSAL